MSYIRKWYGRTATAHEYTRCIMCAMCKQYYAGKRRRLYFGADAAAAAVIGTRGKRSINHTFHYNILLLYTI